MSLLAILAILAILESATCVFATAAEVRPPLPAPKYPLKKLSVMVVRNLGEFVPKTCPSSPAMAANATGVLCKKMGQAGTKTELHLLVNSMRFTSHFREFIEPGICYDLSAPFTGHKGNPRLF